MYSQPGDLLGKLPYIPADFEPQFFIFFSCLGGSAIWHNYSKRMLPDTFTHHKFTILCKKIVIRRSGFRSCRGNQPGHAGGIFGRCF
jgi:hypothetical protein